MIDIENVFGCFDGMSCGQIALHRAGIKFDKYFASEIDAAAMAVTQYHYPETIQLGDIRNIKASDFPKIDLILAGVPCTGFSCQGKGKGFNDPESGLFWKFIDLKNKIKPKYFLVENVATMKKKDQDVFTRELGVAPVPFESSLVSGQERSRLYWHNIPGVVAPEDKNILFSDITENGLVDRKKAYTLTASRGGASLKGYYKRKDRQIVFRHSKDLGPEQFKCINSVDFNARAKRFLTCIDVCLKSHNPNWLKDRCWRELTSIECERLQNIEDNWTLINYKGKQMSNTQRKRMLGKGFTVDIIAHILSFIRTGPRN